MNLSLFDFQDKAVDGLTALLSGGYPLVKLSHSPQAIVLAAPTASGKTVIATAAIEAILFGTDETAADKSAVFLWLTDQPELNRQTIAKMLATSSRLNSDQIIDVEADFSEEKLSPHRIYFINTQKLSKTARLSRGGDKRPFTFWQTIANTVADEDLRLYAVIDEAHRGSTIGTADEEESTGIMQRFIRGSAEYDLPPVPVVFGISATPAKFQRLLADAERGIQPVSVLPDQVRRSGLIKDDIHVIAPDDASRADFTLLREATVTWLRTCEAWREYAEDHDTALIRPLLIVQVEDGDEKTASKTSLSRAIKTVREEGGSLVADDAAFAHAFGSAQDITVGSTALRSLRPSEIDGDRDVQVVFFKTSLNQGWDCPRAEVMMSFRSAKDATLIAQLVGRMVRTPLARRIDERDELNGVHLFLPFFEKETVDKVVEELKETVPGSNTTTGSEPPLVLKRRPRAKALFDALDGLPTYDLPRTRRTTQVRRALKIARLLEIDGIDDEASVSALKALGDVLDDAYETRKKTKAFKEALSDGSTITVIKRTWDPYGVVATDDGTADLTVGPENVEDLFSYAGRRLGEGLHKSFWKRQVASGVASRDAKIAAVVLADDQEVTKNLESTAGQIADELLNQHGKEIDELAAARREEYDAMRGLSAEPIPRALKLPKTIVVRPAKKLAPPKHMYVDSDGKAPVSLNTWERKTVEGEAPTAAGWFRNPDRKEYSLLVPYEMGGALRPVFPDILSLSKVGEEVVVDLLDPHDPDLPDAVPKAHGLAKYARQHGHRYRRIELIRVNGAKVERIDLKASATTDAVLRATTSDGLRALFR